MSVVALNMQQPSGKSHSWSEGPSSPDLSSDRVDVWRVHLDEPSSTVSTSSVLSPDELIRASRFHFEKDRIHFTRCRFALRSLLAGYLAIPTTEIRFEYLTGGKPQLPAEQNPRALQFN